MNKIILNDEYIRKRRDRFSTLFLITGVIFIIIGIFITFLLLNVLTNIIFINKLFISLSIFFFVFMGILFSSFAINKKLTIKKNLYLIVEDTLKRKNDITKTSEVGIVSTNYNLYFENLFKYDIIVNVDYETYDSCSEGDTFYLLFYKDINMPEVFNKRYTSIDDDIKNRIVSFLEIESFINIKKKDI